MEFRIISFDEVSSTNDVAMGAADRYGHGCVLTARRQTAGRGQRGNRWESEPGVNLMFSLVLEPTHILVEEQFRISEMAALAASDAVREATGGGVRCAIKWPNDLYVGDRKLGGILIEHTLQSEYLSRSVVGVGINVGQRRFDASLPNPTSIAGELSDDGTAVLPSPEEVLRAFCGAFERRYAEPGEALHGAFMERLWRADGGFYLYRDAASGERFRAAIEAVDRLTGELTLRLAEGGGVRRYWFKEVEPLLG